MNHALLVRVAQSICNFAKNLCGFLDWKLSALCETRPEILSGDERHRVVQQRSLCAGCKKWNDVRMLQSRRELDLAPESIGVDSRCKIGRKDLDDDLTIELGLSRNKDARHSRAAQLAVDSVGRT
jgi:hypothetical protein